MMILGRITLAIVFVSAMVTVALGATKVTTLEASQLGEPAEEIVHGMGAGGGVRHRLPARGREPGLDQRVPEHRGHVALLFELGPRVSFAPPLLDECLFVDEVSPAGRPRARAAQELAG